jgi:hypothetical protein
MAARFDGIDDYILLPNRYIQAGAFSICVDVIYNTFDSWSRIIDWSDGTWNGNVILANEGTSLNWHWEIYTFAPSSTVQGVSKILEFNGAWWVAGNAWASTCAVVDSNGIMYGYLNGYFMGSTQGWMPQGGLRTEVYIGQSAWAADAHLNGSLECVGRRGGKE